MATEASLAILVRPPLAPDEKRRVEDFIRTIRESKQNNERVEGDRRSLSRSYIVEPDPLICVVRRQVALCSFKG
jgi:hypothetical protein